MNLDDFVNLEKTMDIVTLKPLDELELSFRSLAMEDMIIEEVQIQFGNPFLDYQKKRIIDQAVASKYDLSSVPGYLYKLNDNATYSRVSQRIIKGKESPKVETVDKVYFNNKITDERSINLVIAILGLNISRSNKVELLLKDEVTTLLSDEMIDYEVLTGLKTKLATDPNYDKYYYAIGATLSSITYKKFHEQRFKKNLNLSWLTSDGKVYGAKESFEYKNEVALELIKLKDLII